MQKDIFRQTRFSSLKNDLSLQFQKKADFIYSDAENILRNELRNFDDRGSAIVAKHLRKNILPGFAVYKAVINAGETEDTAVSFVKEALCKATSRMASLSAKMSRKHYTYTLTRLLLRSFLTFAYPKQGWTCEKIEDSTGCVRFNMTSCLYLEELRKRGAVKLCPAFCHTDVVSYSPLAPATIFIRNGTLAQTGEKCDFCFKRGQV